VNTFELTKELMSIPSVSGTEGKVGEFLESHLGNLGYRVERQNVTQDRFNVIAFAGGDPHIILCTHIDTVPPVLPIREDDDFLYGRGACDTKGIIAAMMEAGGRLRRDGKTNFGYLFVVAEETDSSGAKAANTLKWNTNYTIVGEPTENQLARAQKGSMMANLTVKGRAAHSGYPERGIWQSTIFLQCLRMFRTRIGETILSLETVPSILDTSRVASAPTLWPLMRRHRS
jgi:acetylornithine deacetylase